jgi:hypothetical protein
MKLVINNALLSGMEFEELVRDGKLLKRPDGRLMITQNTMESYLQHAEQATKRLALIKAALEQGADVENGPLDAGIFVESAKDVNWRKEFVRVASEDAAKEVNATASKKDYPRLRIFAVGEKQKGSRVAPTPDGCALPEAKPKEDTVEAASA